MENSNLLKAICEKDIDKVRLLLESGKCLPNRDDSNRQAPVLECVASGDQEGAEEDIRRCHLLKILVQHGANVNVQTEIEEFCDLVMPCKTAVMFAAERGFLKCLQFLDESGADLNASCPWGETALLFAVKQKRVECVKYLAEHMSSSGLNSKDENGMTALMLATSLPREEGLLCVQHLVAAGVELNTENGQGRTALMIALRYKFIDAVNLLLDKGALFNTVTWDGFTPLAVAFCGMASNSCSILKLLELGEDPTSSRRNLANVHKSVGFDQKALVRGLVMKGCPPLDVKFDNFIEFKCSRSSVPGGLRQMSPLAVALLCKRPSCARYFIANRFFTQSDIVCLPRNDLIRSSLQEAHSYFRYDNGEKESERRQCLEIFHFLTAQPWSLLTLSLVAVISALSQNLVNGGSNANITACGKNSWVCRPTYREKVKRLDLPLVFKKALLFQTTSSTICSQSWGDILLGEEVNAEACHCGYCKGNKIESDT